MLQETDLTRALMERLEGGRSFEGRDQYIGASEDGRCRRKVVFDKLVPDPESKFTPEAAWRMIQGRVLENEAVQLLRLSGVELRDTGHRQVEARHPSLALVAHSDGTVISDFGFQVVAQDGRGNLEVKSTRSQVLAKWIKEGLPPDYIDQTQVQMGNRGLKWTLFVGVARDGGAKGALHGFFHTWVLDFDAERFAGLEGRAEQTLADLIHVKATIAESGLTLPEDIPSLLDHLPEGEPERGFCEGCPIAASCKAFLGSAPDLAPGTDLDEDARLSLEAILEEMGELSAEVEEPNERIEALKKQGKTFVPVNTSRTFQFGAGAVQVSIQERDDFDKKGLAAAHPEIAATFTKKKPVPTVTFKPRLAGK